MTGEFYLLALSITHICTGLWIYIRTGGNVVSVAGAFALASTIFLGVPGAIQVIQANTPIDPEHIELQIVALAALVMIVVLPNLLPMPESASRRNPRTFPAADVRLSLNRFAVIATLAVIASLSVLVLTAFDVPIGPIVERVMSVGVIATGTWFALESASEGRTHRRSLVILGAMTALYVIATFDGGGRLVLAVPAFTVFCVYLFINPMRFAKCASVILLIPALIGFGIMRSRDRTLTSVLTEGDGLQSVFAPYVTLVKLVQQIRIDNIPHTGFDTFWASLVFWIPREVWPTKPNGLGYELTLLLIPRLAPYNHSMAASYLGELYLAGGYLCIAVGIAVLALGVNSLDRALLSITGRENLTVFRTISMVGIYLVASGLFDYVWAGSFNFFSRDVARILIWLSLSFSVVLLFWFGARKSGKQ